MFLGSTNLALDAKGRIAIPARYRKKLQDLCEGTVAITHHPYDGCLPIYPLNVWEECMQAMELVEDESADFRFIQREIYANTEEVDMDGSGRLLVPQKLREKVGLEKNAVLIGHGNKFELWDEQSWLHTSKENNEKFVETLKAKTERVNIGFRL